MSWNAQGRNLTARKEQGSWEREGIDPSFEKLRHPKKEGNDWAEGRRAHRAAHRGLGSSLEWPGSILSPGKNSFEGHDGHISPGTRCSHPPRGM